MKSNAGARRSSAAGVATAGLIAAAVLGAAPPGPVSANPLDGTWQTVSAPPSSPHRNSPPERTQR